VWVLPLVAAACSQGGGPKPLCTAGARRCSADALSIEECVAGAWQPADACMTDQGQLCEASAAAGDPSNTAVSCVDSWRYGSPSFDACTDDPHATTTSLADKAARLDRLGEVLHVHPGDDRVHDVTVRAGLTDATATETDVIDWHPQENDGLWTGLYIASQAFRYAVTREPGVLDHLRVLMDGFERGMKITGDPGVFTREYITPGLTGMACPTDPSAYIPDVEKDDNKWVKIDTDGTVLVYDPTAAAFTRTSHKVPAEYAGYCWLDNVSKDEYAGHMMGLGTLLKLVDDPGIHARAEALAEQVADHLMRNRMVFIDWDGRITEHGRLWPTAIDDFPDFNAILGLNHVKIGAVASGRADLRQFYDDCLLQKSGPTNCIQRFPSVEKPYTYWLNATGLYVGHDACMSNWNNLGMEFSAILTLVWYEQDPSTRAELQSFLENKMYRNHDNIREMARQGNAAWSFVEAAMKSEGPGSTGPDYDAVHTGVCALREFPESKARPELHVGEDLFPTDLSCESRFDGVFLTHDAVPVWERCPRNFTWWAIPYEHQDCTADPTEIAQPADYLLAYWMGRYFGFIDPSW